MVTDRGHRDEAQAFDRVDQHKCLAHILRSISDVGERKTGRAPKFGEQLKDALALWHAHRDGQAPDFKVAAQTPQAAITSQLRDRRLKDPDHQRRLNELGWHHDRGHVWRFLVDPRIEPTNNRAERALRPAVSARKVSQCSEHTQDAVAFAAFTSVLRTLRNTGVGSLVEALAQLFHPTPPHQVRT